MFRTEPAFLTSPGVVITDDGVVFAAVFRQDQQCGIVLYHLDDGHSVKIPFTEECRMGSLYSVKVSGLDTKSWGYRLYCGDKTFLDPSARELMTVRGQAQEITVGGFYYRADDRLAPERDFSHRAWQDEFIYSLHIKGFTINSRDVEHPGTFRAAADRIPYLKSLGVTAVEIMPVYELFENKGAGDEPRTMEEALRLYPVSADGMPVRDLNFVSVNYWGYGRGYYFAPKRAYSSAQEPGGPQRELADMVERFHRAGIAVYLQLYFTGAESADVQVQAARFYVTHYKVDGFHLLGRIADLKGIVSDPLLSDARMIADGFPYDEISREDLHNPEAGIVSVSNLADCSQTFSDLARHLVKSDDHVLHAFLRSFMSVPGEHGSIHYICRSDGFTLYDLVSYNERHNCANGEGGLDGRENNISWNCGAEGETDNEDILTLRRNQIRNFLTLLFLSQGTPLLNAGDECLNTQKGNNNPYCQDNEIGWTDCGDSEDAKYIREFVMKLSRFRSEHRVFRMDRPFTGTDSLACGFPDMSFHGAEAWKPDFGAFSHSIGICLCENYCDDSDEINLLYIAVNMHWTPQPLGLPKIMPNRRWAVLMDTSQEESFWPEPQIVSDQHFAIVPPRSVQVLSTVKRPAQKRRRKKHDSPTVRSQEMINEQSKEAKSAESDHTEEV